MFLPSSSRKHIIVACRLNPSPRHSIQLVSDEPGAIHCDAVVLYSEVRDWTYPESVDG